MPAADEGVKPFSPNETAALFDRFAHYHSLVLAVSGGPDSIGMLVAMAAWRAARAAGPALFVASVDHGLRPEAQAECALVMATAKRFSLPAATLLWEGAKPTTGVQREAREARYRLLIAHAKSVGAPAIVTAHTISDQSETVLMRFIKGSGPLGLKAMAEVSERDGVTILRPFLWQDGARLAATAQAAGQPTIADPSNIDDLYTRVRIRKMIGAMEREGLDWSKLPIFAGRMRLIDDALRHQARKLSEATRRPSVVPRTEVYEAKRFLEEPIAAVQMLLSEAMERVGETTIAERLAALEEASVEVLMALAEERAFKTTLRGALLAVTPDGRLILSKAPPRRSEEG